MVTTIDLSQIGASQASALAYLQKPSPLPINAAQFPLMPGQFYGQVATNCRTVNAKAGSNKGLSARNHHRARGTITEIAIVLPNWYVERSASKFEYPNNGGTICAASIEYPAGTFHRLSFDGAVRELIPGGHYVISELLSLAIPDNAEFWSNIWLSASTTIVFFNGATGQVSANGERSTVATGDVADFSMTSHTGGAQSYGLWPMALIGRTSGRTITLFGDSLGEGVGDVADSGDHVGVFARLVGNGCGYINHSQSGDRLELMLQSHSKRLAALAYTRNAILGLGVNDISAGRSLPQIKADMIAMWHKIKDALPIEGRLFQSTITPSTTSTDSFTTLANQTPAAPFSVSGNGVREQLNDWLRNGAPINEGFAVPIGTAVANRSGDGVHPLHGILDLADTVESSRNSGKWRVDGTAFKWTADGVHLTNHAYIQAASSLQPALSQFV